MYLDSVKYALKSVLQADKSQGQKTCLREMFSKLMKHPRVDQSEGQFFIYCSWTIRMSHGTKGNSIAAHRWSTCFFFFLPKKMCVGESCNYIQLRQKCFMFTGGYFHLGGVYWVIKMYVKFYCVVRIQFRSTKEKGAWNFCIKCLLYL